MRVRGLLHSAALASRLAAAGIEVRHIRLDTGSVRVPLTPKRDEAFWIVWLSAQVTDAAEPTVHLKVHADVAMQLVKPYGEHCRFH